MPSFNIVKKANIDKTFRVAKIMADYDVKEEHVQEHFIGDIDLPSDWNIGVIVGGSGTGKTTIAKELFGDKMCDNLVYTHKSVVDDMPKNCSVNDIEKMFYSVGFGSVPSWLKPYGLLSNGEKMRVDFYSVGFGSVPSWLKPYGLLSNGEKMRVDLARALLEKDFVVFDEFTSVVDRNVAQTSCIAVSKAIRSNNKKFIAVSCHYDILNWLQPDWVYDTNERKYFFTKAHDTKKNLQSLVVGEMNGKNLGGITI